MRSTPRFRRMWIAPAFVLAAAVALGACGKGGGAGQAQGAGAGGGAPGARSAQAAADPGRGRGGRRRGASPATTRRPPRSRPTKRPRSWPAFRASSKSSCAKRATWSPKAPSSSSSTTTSISSASSRPKPRTRISRRACERMEKMREQDLVSTEEYDKVVNDLAAAKAAEGMARLNLSYTRVTAPFAGRVVTRNVDPGQTVNVGTQLFVLVRLHAAARARARPVEGVQQAQARPTRRPRAREQRDQAQGSHPAGESHHRSLQRHHQGDGRDQRLSGRRAPRRLRAGEHRHRAAATTRPWCRRSHSSTIAASRSSTFRKPTPPPSVAWWSSASRTTQNAEITPGRRRSASAWS